MSTGWVSESEPPGPFAVTCIGSVVTAALISNSALQPSAPFVSGSLVMPPTLNVTESTTPVISAS